MSFLRVAVIARKKFDANWLCSFDVVFIAIKITKATMNIEALRNKSF